MFRFKEYRFKYFNIRLVFFIIIICILGILVIGSATDYDYEKKQLICFIVGLAVMLFLSVVDYHFILKFHWLIYIVNLGFLMLVYVIGDSGNGAQRWIRFGGGIGLQPSELAKIMLILFFAKFFQTYREKLNSIQVLAASAVLFGIPLFLVYKQPDLSTSLVIIFIFCAMIFVAGLSYIIIGAALGIGLPVATFMIYKIMQPGQDIITDYQKNRILGFLYQDGTNPNVDMEAINAVNYQQKNSVLAIGSGQLYGKGLNNNTIASVKNGNFISEPQTDFIYSIVGEELGFIGAVAVIILLLLIALECLWIAKNAKDLSGKIICTGMASIIAFQGFINMGVATWILPNTGLPLPFVSYGMSSLMSLLIGMGIVLNVGIQRELTFKEVLYTEY